MSTSHNSEQQPDASKTVLEKTQSAAPAIKKRIKKNPFLAIVGTGNGMYTTDEVMRMTRGDVDED
jgi:fructoselysine-6-P-deglycase FrlB-like protein